MEEEGNFYREKEALHFLKNFKLTSKICIIYQLVLRDFLLNAYFHAFLYHEVGYLI